jgi:hypothetical protein
MTPAKGVISQMRPARPAHPALPEGHPNSFVKPRKFANTSPATLLRMARRQRYPAGVLAVVSGVAIDVRGAVGGGVVVAVASGADLTVFVPACSLATATAPMSTTALAPITADSNLTFFCWSTLTTPFGPGLSATRRSVPLRKVHRTYVAYPQKGHSKRAALALPGGGPNTLDASTSRLAVMQCFAD